jgi:hypothetical protein
VTALPTGRRRPALLYFGNRWDAPLFDDVDAVQVLTPVGRTDPYCGDMIQEGDRGFLRSAVAADGDWQLLPVHRECELRNVLGGFDHLQGRCRYTGHCNELREQAGRSLREDALAVWAWIEQHGVRA